MSKYQPEPKVLKFEDPSYIKLAAQIGSLDAAKAEAQHSHVVADVTDASTELATKSHTHTKSDISDFGSYAAVSHTHTESDITDLQNYSLDGHTHSSTDITDVNLLASASHTHTEADITDLKNYALNNHTHTESDITDLQNYSLDGHTHSSTDITDLSTAISTDLQHFIRCYETADLDSVSMEDGESFLYFDLTTGELCKRSKSGDDITTTKIGKLSAIEE